MVGLAGLAGSDGRVAEYCERTDSGSAAVVGEAGVAGWVVPGRPEDPVLSVVLEGPIEVFARFARNLWQDCSEAAVLGLALIFARHWSYLMGMLHQLEACSCWSCEYW